MKFKSEVPEGKSGIYTIEKFTISEKQAKFDELRNQISLFQGGSFRPVEPGTFTRLMTNSHVLMSDTPAELEDFEYFIDGCSGSGLISGLGLGVVTEMVLQKPEVTHVTVLEISPDVILLVGDFLKSKYGDRLEIIHTDAFLWKPTKGIKYDFVWHDIWDDICADHLPEMSKLKRKFGRYTKNQECWAYIEHLRAKRRWG
jgi:hypothetical protein